MAKPPEPPSLADLRKEIDRIDEAMHGLLMERGEIIDRLIGVSSCARSRNDAPPGQTP
jgi:chorismate mutase